MSLVKKLIKAGVVERVVREARKPENQEKAKAQLSSAQSKYKDWKAKKRSN